MKITSSYDKENNIFSVWWGKKGEYDVSEEIKDGSIILDLNKKGEIIGIEIMDWKKGEKKK